MLEFLFQLEFNGLKTFSDIYWYRGSNYILYIIKTIYRKIKIIYTFTVLCCFVIKSWQILYSHNTMTRLIEQRFNSNSI